MASPVDEQFLLQEDDELLTTTEAAKILGVSRQHVVDLAERGVLPFSLVGKHRRIRRADLQFVRTSSTRMTRDQLRSLWLGHAIAGRIVMDPERHLAQASHRLEHGVRPLNRWELEWQKLLSGPVEGVLQALTSPSPKNRELRQNSPFTAVLTDDERADALRAFGDASHRR